MYEVQKQKRPAHPSTFLSVHCIAPTTTKSGGVALKIKKSVVVTQDCPWYSCDSREGIAFIHQPVFLQLLFSPFSGIFAIPFNHTSYHFNSESSREECVKKYEKTYKRKIRNHALECAGCHLGTHVWSDKRIYSNIHTYIQSLYACASKCSYRANCAVSHKL